MRYHQKLILPILPNPWCYVEIKGDELQYKTWGTKHYSLNVQKIRATLKPRGFSSLLGFGSVVFDVDGRSYEAEDLINGRGLRQHVDRIVEKVSEPNWFDGLTDDKLKSESIIIPNVYSTLIYLMVGVEKGHHRRMWNGNPAVTKEAGDWVRAGEVLCYTGFGANIVAPCDGRVRHTFCIQFGWDTKTGWPRVSSSGFQQNLKDMSLAVIQPLKNSGPLENYVQVAFGPFLKESYNALSKLESMSLEKFRDHFCKEFKHADDDPSTLKAELISHTTLAIKLIEQAKPHTVVGGEVETLPEWPTKEWIAKNAPRAGIEWICDEPKTA